MAKKAKTASTPMTDVEIQARVDAMCKALSSRGLREPHVDASFTSHVEPNVYYRWTKANALSSCDWVGHWVKGDTMQEAIQKAEAEIAALPTAEQTKFDEFMGAVANAVDIGRKNGIDVEFVNPLAETMKRLSENALTYQPAA